jgi:hypothetical protein
MGMEAEEHRARAGPTRKPCASIDTREAEAASAALFRRF